MDWPFFRSIEQNETKIKNKKTNKYVSSSTKVSTFTYIREAKWCQISEKIPIDMFQRIAHMHNWMNKKISGRRVNEWASVRLYILSGIRFSDFTHSVNGNRSIYVTVYIVQHSHWTLSCKQNTEEELRTITKTEEDCACEKWWITSVQIGKQSLRIRIIIINESKLTVR